MMCVKLICAAAWIIFAGTAARAVEVTIVNDLYVTVVKDPNDPQARGSVVKISNDQN